MRRKEGRKLKGEEREERQAYDARDEAGKRFTELLVPSVNQSACVW